MSNDILIGFRTMPKDLGALLEEEGFEFESLMEIIQKEIDRENPMPVHFFASYVRDKNIQYLTSSAYFLTNYREYEMAPGFYNGCVPIS